MIFFKAGSQTWEGSSPASVCWPSFDSWGPVRYRQKELYGATMLWSHNHRHLGLMHSHGLVIANTILEQRVIQYLVREQLRPKIDNCHICGHLSWTCGHPEGELGGGDCKPKLLERVNLECQAEAPVSCIPGCHASQGRLGIWNPRGLYSKQWLRVDV